MTHEASKFFCRLAAALILAFTGACGTTSSPETTEPEPISSAQEALAGCAGAGTGQTFSAGMIGCPGAVTWANRASLCAAGYVPASAFDFLTSHFGITPAHNYWTNDQLGYSGTGTGNCGAKYSSAGFSCPAGQPMHICTPSGTDPEGNHCNWTQCGIDCASGACSGDFSGNLNFGGCAGNTTAGTLCVPVGCSGGPSAVAQTWVGGAAAPGKIVGCKGAVTFLSRASLCAPGYRVATSYDWHRIFAGVAPTHNYWTDDPLTFSGSSSACFVGLDGSSCGSTPMRVCTAGGTDAEGNQCNWKNCGLNAATPNDYFGGCAGNTTAGTLCISEEGCSSNLQTQVFSNNLVSCAAKNGWPARNQVCSAGWSAASSHQWSVKRGIGVPVESSWTNDNLGYLGTGTGACAASLGGTSCGTNQPMRLCPATSPDPDGNLCNWTNCGLGTNSPNLFFGGCAGNLTAGSLCGKADLVTTVQNIQNITTEPFGPGTAHAADVLDACITTGTHRVMRFDFHSKNIGTADAFLGSPPADPNAFSPVFIYSQAHGHWHVRHFNIYGMLNINNPVMRAGAKQAFCLEDFNQWDSTADPLRYTCSFQGVSPGWEDIYYSGLPCQFMNMDGLGDGTYLFNAQTNTSRVVPEGDYSNNTTTQALQITGDTVTPVPFPTPTGCTTVASGQMLTKGGSIQSCDGRFKLLMQGDGNLVLYWNGVGALWATGTNYTSGSFAVMQGDGNFVLYDASLSPIWSSNTGGHPGAVLSMQNDGNLVVYSGVTPLWASNTCCH